MVTVQDLKERLEANPAIPLTLIQSTRPSYYDEEESFYALYERGDPYYQYDWYELSDTLDAEEVVWIDNFIADWEANHEL